MTDEKKLFPATVVKVIDHYTVVINRGIEHGIKLDQEFLIYAIGDELKDPDTGESLGVLEIIRGTGEVTHVQEKMATILSNQFAKPDKKVVRRKPGFVGFGFEEVETVESATGPRYAFEDPEVGDRARPTGRFNSQKIGRVF